MGLIINGKTANTQPNRPLVISGKHQRLVTPVVNGLVPYHININGLDRPPVPSGCVFNAPLWHPALGGTTFKSLDANLISCTVSGAYRTPSGRTFDGVDDNISLGSPTSIPSGNADRTYEAWIKQSSTATYRYIWGTGTNAVTNDVFWFGIWTDGNRPAVLTAGAGTLLEGSIWDTTVWHHLVATYSAGLLSLFVDGVADGTLTLPGGATNTNGTVTWLGKTQGASAAQHFPGTIGEVRIYSRVLTASEIKNNYLVTKWRYS